VLHQMRSAYRFLRIAHHADPIQPLARNWGPARNNLRGRRCAVEIEVAWPAWKSVAQFYWPSPIPGKTVLPEWWPPIAPDRSACRQESCRVQSSLSR